jgi:hypothetical protein
MKSYIERFIMVGIDKEYNTLDVARAMRNERVQALREEFGGEYDDA